MYRHARGLRARLFFSILYAMMEKNQTPRFRSGPSLIRFFLRGSLHDFLFSILFASLVSLLDMLNPRIISFAVDSVIGNLKPVLPAPLMDALNGIGGISYLKSRFYLIGLLVAGVALLAAVCRYLFHALNARGAEKLVKRMRDTLYAHLQKLPQSWYGENSTGDIIQRCTSDVDLIKTFLSERLTELIRMIVLIVMAVSFMASISPRMTFFSSLFIPVVVLFGLIFHVKISGAFMKVDVEEGKLSAIVQENLTGVRVVRAFGREQFERTRFEDHNTLYTNHWVRLINILSVYWSIGDLLTGLQLLLVTVLGAVFCVRGRITAGEYIAFVSYNAMLTWPVRAMGRTISDMSKAGISVGRLLYIMNASPEEEPVDALTPPLDRTITFSHVSFRYPGSAGEAEALHDVSFEIPAGTTLGIIGSTGSGKTTVARLLEKLWPLEPGCGSITIGENDIRDISTSYLRQGIGLVMQEPYLFSRTLSENLRVSSPSSTDRDLRRAVRIASLEETIDHFPQGYDTFVGERGVTLSGGQKQRAAIAQMLIRKTPVMIFDDSLSAVDAGTDARIREALKTETAGATVILIAHRISTVMDADQIIVLDGGRIAERGTHASLVAEGGIYAKTWRLQTAAPASGEGKGGIA